MEDEIRISAASEADVPFIKSLLSQANLATDEVDGQWKMFVVARDGTKVVGCGGSEPYQFAAIIRSIAVDPTYRKQGIGRRLVRQLIDRLASRGLREFYLLTTDGEEYFRKRGFKTIDRDEVHPQVLASRQFQGECPDSAICMRLVMLV